MRTPASCPKTPPIQRFSGTFQELLGRRSGRPRYRGPEVSVLDVVFVVASIVFFVAGAAYIGACRALERFRS
jgi:hypothetical protein